MNAPIMKKSDAAELIVAARIRAGLSWNDIAERIDAPVVWTVAALLGQHPVPAEKAELVCEMLGLGEGVAESLRNNPRGSATTIWPPTRPSIASTRRWPCTVRPSRN